MELTFIPIAAILLLLTAFQGPSRLLEDGCGPAASSLRLWLTRENPHRTSRRAERGSRSASNRRWAHRQAARHLHAQQTAAQGVLIASRDRALTLFRTRFGVASCAYCAAAPPAAAFRSWPTAA